MEYTFEPVDFDPIPLAGTEVPGPAAAPAVPEPPEAPAPAPAAADYTIPKAPPLPTVTDENAPKTGGTAEQQYDLEPVDFDPVPLSEVYDPKSDYGFTRGAKVGWTGSGGAIKTALDMPRLATLDDAALTQELLAMGQRKADPRNAQLQVQGVEDIHGFGDAVTYLTESAGQLLGSWGAAGVYGGGTGALVGGAGGAALGAAGGLGVGAGPGAVAGGVGGFTYGTMTSFGVMGVGGMLEDLTSDPGVQKGLKDGTIKPKQLLALATGTGAAIGALDALPAGKVIGQLGGKQLTKEAVKELIKTSVTKAAAKGAGMGALEEGGTEALQGAISEVTQALAGGNTNLPERALSVLNQGLVGAVGGAGPGAVGGVVENARIPTEGEKDTEQDAADPALPEGVPATPDDGGTGAGGSPAATTAPPPEGVIPEPAKQAPPTVTPTVDPAVGAALGASPPPPGWAPDRPWAASGQPGAIPDVEEEEEAVVDEADPRAAELDRITREMYANEARDAQKTAQETAAATVKVAEANSDVAAALGEAAKKVSRGRGKAQQETVGTGLNPSLQPQPTVPLTPAAPVTIPIPPAVQATQEGAGAGVVDASQAAAPAVVETPIAQPATPAPPVPAVPLTPAPAAPATPVDTGLVPPAPAATANYTLEPVDFDPIPITAAAAAPVPAVTVPAATVPGAKGAVVKEKVARKKKVEVVIPKKPAAEIVKREDVPAWSAAPAVAETAPAAAAEPKAPQTKMTRDAAAFARADEKLQRSPASEAHDFITTSEEVAAEVLHKHGRQGRSPREIIEGHAREIADEIERRLAPAGEAIVAERTEAETKKEKSLAKTEAEAKAEAKKAEMATTTVGQKKERYSAKKGGLGKSAGGIATQADDSWSAMEKRELTKKPEERDQRVMKYAQLMREEAKISTPERKAEIKAEKAAIRDEIVAELKRKEEAEAAKPKGLDEAAKKQQAKVEGILKTVPLPTATSEKAWHDNLKAFVEAGKGIATGLNVTRGTKSSAENLLIWSRRLLESLKGKRKNAPDLYSDGIAEYQMARFFQQQGADEDLYNLIGTEKIKGQELQEDRTAEEGDFSKALHEDETSVQRQSHQEVQASVEQYEAGVIVEPRRGREKTIAARTAEDRRGRGVFEEETLLPTADGDVIMAPATTYKAKNLLNELSRTAPQRGGFLSLLQHVHIRHLKQLVGDVDVIFVNRETMQRLDPNQPPGRTLGMYFNYDAASRALGDKPLVYMDEGLSFDPVEYEHTLIHELTHAATSYAIRYNLRNTSRIIGSMRLGLERQLEARFSEAELEERGLKYAFKNDAEFIAEAFSNQAFQRVMAEMVVPPKLAVEIAGLKRGGMPTWWDAFTAAVSNAIGMIKGARGQTYMEQVIALYPSIAVSSRTQQTLAENETFGKPPRGLLRAEPRSTVDVDHFNLEFANVKDAVESKWSSGWATVGKNGLLNGISTTGEMMRKAAAIMGGPVNAFHDLASAMLRKDQLRAKYRAMGEALELSLLRYKKTHPEAYKALSTFLGEASRNKIDPRHPLNHEANKHISKTGARGEGQRAAHKEMAAEWAKLPQESKDLANAIDKHYGMMHERQTLETIRTAIRQAIKKHHVTLPAGKSLDDAVAWVRGAPGQADWIGHKEEERTAEDKVWHDALGNTAKTLANVSELRRLPGIYVPLTRQGRFFITGRMKVDTPKGATIDPTGDGNRFIFKDEKLAREFMASAEFMPKFSTRWIDPQTGTTTDHITGQKISSKEPHAVRQVIVTVQNKFMHMDDNQGKLQKLRDRLVKDGHSVDHVALTEQFLNAGGGREITSPELQSLLKNIADTTVGKMTIGAQAAQNALIDAHIRSMVTPGALARGLKREGILGYEEDLAKAMREYNRSASSHLANMEMAPQLAEADSALDKYLTDRRKTTGGQDMLKLQMMQRELHDRINSKHFTATRDTVGGRFASAAMDATYLRHLFSPHYSIIQMLQPFMTTYPVLAAKYGHAAAWRAIVDAYRIGGIRKTLGKGFGETWSATKQLRPGAEQRADLNVHDTMWHDMVSGQADVTDLRDMMEDLYNHGFGAGSGIEAGGISEQDLTPPEKALKRVMNVAKGLPEAAEGINRYVTAIATYRLARQAGATHEVAKREAVLGVEQTQGGYARANNPTFFQNPLMKFPLQFKKYGLMYGQMFYGNLAKSMDFRNDPEGAKIARKTVARLAATTFIFAGVGGMPFIELARVLVNVALLAGLTDDDWDDWENGMQEWFASMIGWATGSEGLGDKLSEASIRGLTRLVGIDTSAALGSDNLVTFGQPKSTNEEDVKSWLFDALVLGAGGSMIGDSLSALHDGDVSGVVPWPKLIDNITKAYGLYSEGSTDPITGEQYTPPVNIGEAIVQAAGFRPASQSREWEAGGPARAQKEERELRAKRRTLMGRWSNAGPKEKRSIEQEVKAWNKGQTDRKMRIDAGDLYRSRRERERQRKEREKMREEA